MPNDTKLRSATGTTVARIALEPGTLPDMTCGVNGEPFQKRFRPDHIDVETDANGEPVQVRIYGLEIRMDGSLGLRELDHMWRR